MASRVNKAVVLLSGGMDSAVTLGYALSKGHACHAVSFDYGQKHAVELKYAQRIAERLGACAHQNIKLDRSLFRGSALTENALSVLGHTDLHRECMDAAADYIPDTYVPARNTVFLSMALAYSEVLAAGHIFIGANAVDYSGYPDCRPEYLAAFQNMADLATKSAVSGHPVHVHAPLIGLGKNEIVALGIELGIDFSKTVSCYQPDDEGRACGYCDACRLRKQGFAQAAVADATRYIPAAK